MSDQHHPDRQTDPTAVIDLLDRAGHVAPTMSVEPEVVIGAGRRRVRRRRGSVVGSVGVLTLAGALWLGGPLNPFAPTDPPVPAVVAWQGGVDVELFDTSPHPVHEADRTHWIGQLRSDAGDAFPELVLTRDGKQLDPVAAQDGPGDVLVFQEEGMSVAVWQSPGGSLGERPQWAPGADAGQGGDVSVQGAELRYSVAEFVPGSTGELDELYWFTDDAAHAASGAPVESTVLTAGGTRALVMLDEARGVWGTSDLESPGGAGPFHVERLVAGSGLSGWTGEETAAASVGVLPPRASEPSVRSETAVLAQAQLGSSTAVLATDPAHDLTAPVIRFTQDGTEHTLESYVLHSKSLVAGSVQLLVTAQPKNLELRQGEKWALIAAEDLVDGRALAVPVVGGQVVVVPGWELDAEPEDLRVLVATDDDERWVEGQDVYVDTLFDGRPVVILGLDRDAIDDGETVRGVGAVEDDEVVQHRLTGGVLERDFDLDL